MPMPTFKEMLFSDNNAAHSDEQVESLALRGNDR